MRFGLSGGTKGGTKKKTPMKGLEEMADRTGLEPATSGVTGRHSNRLNYRSAEKHFCLVRKSGGRYKTRTCDPCLVRALLYQLS